MKIKYIAGITLLAMAGSLNLTSCKSDYLDEAPQTSKTQSSLGESAQNAQAAMRGICLAMNLATYGSATDRFMSGEGWIQTYYGDAASPDFWDGMFWPTQYYMQNWVLMTKAYAGAYACNMGWMYGYNLISQANVILKYIDEIDDDPDLIAFIKAQTLTLRAHGYIRLMQIYGPRYEDQGANGSELCLVIRTEPGTEAIGLSSYKDCIAFIENDLDEAIKLYQQSGLKRSYGYEPDLSIAQALYSRIALWNHEWEVASKMAEAARSSYPIMSQEDYLAGFNAPTSEWLWYNDEDNNWTGYMGWGAVFSCTGIYPVQNSWAGAGCISFKLYDQIYDRYPEDVRCQQFWTPDKANKYANLNLKREYFWNPNYIDATGDVLNEGFMYGTGMNSNMTVAISLYARHMNPDPDVYTDPAYGVNVNISDADAGNIVQRLKWFREEGQETQTFQIGAQTKFWSYPQSTYNRYQHPYLRSAELLLNQAEAEYEMGNQNKALQLLIELNSQRIDGYTCALSGEALRDEIRLYRRMELWGEGDCWFSFKRWNLPISRQAWIANDPNSDTFPSAMIADDIATLPNATRTYQPDEPNNWRYWIPRSETNYNPIVAGQIE